MKLKSSLIVLLLALNHTPAWATDACPALLKHTFLRLQDDVAQPLCQYQGKVLLEVVEQMTVDPVQNQSPVL